MPIVYSTTPSESVKFYEALGLSTVRQARNGIWFELDCGGASLGVHAAPPAKSGAVELALVSDEPLEGVTARLSALGIETIDGEGIRDDEFGRSIQLRDPGGAIVQINEHDHDLYT